jgi:hypothetical protein
MGRYHASAEEGSHAQRLRAARGCLRENRPPSQGFS